MWVHWGAWAITCEGAQGGCTVWGGWGLGFHQPLEYAVAEQRRA